VNDALSFLTGLGVGAGLMYVFDPQMGRRRRALARDKAVSLAHQAQDTGRVVARDMANRAQGLASGDLSVLVGGKQALRHPLRGSWSPSARALMVAGGTGLFAYALTRSAPTACVLGTLGLALAAEGATNAGLSDLGDAACGVADRAREMAGNLTESLGLTGQREAAADRPAAQAAGAGI
jgi:hypothetical protein